MNLTWANERRRLRELVVWEHNPRQIGKAQASRLADSLEQFGQIHAIAIGPDGEIYDGHQRTNVWAAADKFGPDYEVDVRVASRPLTEAERRKLVTYLHSGTTGDWDWDALSGWDVGELVTWGFDAEQVTAWDNDAANLRTMIEAEAEEPPADPGAQVDRAEELREKWGVESGQLWRLGEHRLICGDCTDAGVVARVMGGERAGLLFTSPPYAQQRDYTDASDASDWDALMRGAFGAMQMAEDGQVLVNLGLVHRDSEWQPYWDGWIEWMRGQGWRRFGWYVWDQGSGLPGDWAGRFAPGFEFVFHFNKAAVRPMKWVECKSAGQRTGMSFRSSDGSLKDFTHSGEPVQATKIPDAVIRENRQAGSVGEDLDHPAPFSVDFAVYVVKSWPGIVYEPFSGSGTTLIACERLGRKCRGIEIEPKYVAVAIERWAQMTGGTPELVG